MKIVSKSYPLKVLFGFIAITMMIVSSGCTGTASAAAPLFETEPIVFGDLSANIIANGVVRPNRSQDISWQTSGIVEKVNVEFLAPVVAGEQMAVLQESSLPQNVILTQADLINARNELETLKNSEVQNQEAYLSMVQAEEELADLVDERRLMNYQRCRESTTDANYADYLLAKDKYENLQDDYNEFYAHKAEDDLSRANALSNLSKAKEEYERALVNLNYCRNKADSQEVIEKDAEVSVAEAKFQDAQREWERLKDGADPDDIAVLEQRIMAYEATLAQAYLTAPFDGYVSDSGVKPGDKVSTGKYAFQVEDNSHVYVDVEVSEIDINRVACGQQVVLTFDAAYGEEYQGEVVQVGASGASDQGVVNFEVTIEILDADAYIKSGMTASAHIQVDKVEDSLLVPNRAIRIKDDKRVVYILSGVDAEPQAVPITLGVTNGVQSQVVEGDVKAGDLIVLNPDVLYDTNTIVMGGG